MKSKTALFGIVLGIVGAGCGSTSDVGLHNDSTGPDASPSPMGVDGSAGSSSDASTVKPTEAAGDAVAADAATGNRTATDAATDDATADQATADQTTAGQATADASTADGSAADVAAADARAPGMPDGAPIVAPPFTATYHLGADITWVQHDEFYGATYVDSDGVQKDILALLKNHGFNSVRLRTFVDPTASDGYDKFGGFGDLAHTVIMAQRIRLAGMGFLLDFHYSDNWADPGKQCIPVAWQHDGSGDAGSADGGVTTTFAQLTQHVYDYTFGALTALKNAGALPELVQIGNEITPGMLIHICDANGIPLAGAAGISPVNGRATNWANLGALLKAGIQAVKAVDPSIKTVLHIDKGGDANASSAFIMNAQAQGVPFDVFADTCYVRYQGQPIGWQNTFKTLATTFPALSFVIPEYGNETATNPATPTTMRIANDTIFNIAGSRGLGTWVYEPEHPAQAAVGIGLFMSTTTDAGLMDSWPVFTVIPGAMAVYDQMRTAYAGRL